MTEPKKPKSHKKDAAKPWNHFRAQERQEYFFLVYEQMGTTRTLKRLWGVLRGVSIPVSLKTLEEYSAKYGWQARILERAARHESGELVEAQAQVKRMNTEHVQTFLGIGALVNAGIEHYKSKISEYQGAGLGPTLQMDLSDMGKLAEVYQRGERLARGQATSKAEVIVEVLQPVVKDIMAVFLAVNIITNDPPEVVRKRQAEFVKRGDQVLMTYYGGPKQITEGRGD